jgi:hypothetical protein
MRHPRSTYCFHNTNQGDKVIPTEHTAKPASTPKTGLVATLRALLHAQGSGAPARSLIVVPLMTLCAVFGVLTLCVGLAGAATSKLVLNGSFHAEGASGIAVDQSSGDVFTAGFLGISKGSFVEGRGEKFDASGDVLSPPSPFAEGLHYGAALNPTNGRLYVASAFGEIEIYDPSTGALISSFEVPPSWVTPISEEIFANNVQIATDAAGDVYVPNPPGNEVLKYSETGTLLGSFTGSGVHALKQPMGVAVDASGNVWVADAGNERVEEFSSTGVFLDEFESEGVRALALDGHGDVLAIVDNSADDCEAIKPPCEHMVEYSESGAQLADIGAGYFGSSTDELGGARLKESMVAVDQATGRVYVTDGLKNVVWIAEPPLAPVIGQESAAEVDTSEAKLGVLVQPGGIQTTYRFEYLTEAGFRADKESFSGPAEPVSVPLPEGSAGEGFSARVVWASAKGLAQGATYYYRAVVTNALGTVTGPDQTLTTQASAQASCPNEQARGGFSAGLPECRAYELVTPPGKSSAQPDTFTEASFNEENENGETESDYIGGLRDSVAATDGDRFAYESAEVMPGAQTPGLEFLATRGPNGWSSEDALPLRPYTANRCTFPVSSQTVVVKYSPDLSRTILIDNAKQGTHDQSEFSEGCRGEDVEVVSGEPFEQNLLAHDNEDGAYQLVNLTPADVEPEPATFIAASADLNVVVFSERSKLTPDAVSGAENLYEWSEGALRLLKLELPSGAPVAGSSVSFSADGSDLLFTANGNLYVRVDGERTVQVDEAREGSGPGGGGELAAVSANGSQVFFTDNATAGLTSDTVAGSGKNLYVYNVSTGQQSDLTPVADAKATFKDISEDGSYVYFSSEGVQSGSQTNQLDETAQNGKPNLYVEHDGTNTFVMNATLITPPKDDGNIEAISRNGAFLAFESTNSLTGYDNSGDYEIYLYSALANRFECASCNPSGEAPTDRGAILGGVPDGVSDNGQVFFETREALLPRDTNGQWDVYEFDYIGGLHLISTGTGTGASVLADASVTGNDVFFRTSQSLVPQDSFQEANKIYDARVDGGFPEAALPPACTTADACRAAASPQPSIYGEPASQTFSGAGNLVPPEAKPKEKPKAKPVSCKKRFVKRKGKCLKKTAMKAKKSVHANRRGK